MSSTDLLGKKVIITNKEHTDYQNWEIIKAYDGEYFHVAMNNDDRACLVFARDEFKVKRKGYE